MPPAGNLDAILASTLLVGSPRALGVSRGAFEVSGRCVIQ